MVAASLQDRVGVATMSSSMSAPLMRLWCEPWVDADPSWHRPRVAPPAWENLSCASPQGLRLAYRAWCHHFEITPSHPVLPTDASLVLMRQVAWDRAALERAARFIGMVGVAGTSAFASLWMREREAALQCADVHAWRRAVALARARAIEADPATRIAMDTASLTTWGWCRLRSLLETLWPQSWARLRFRCDEVSVRCTPELRPSAFCAPLEFPDARHMLRAWLLSGDVQTTSEP